MVVVDGDVDILAHSLLHADSEGIDKARARYIRIKD